MKNRTMMQICILLTLFVLLTACTQGMEGGTPEPAQESIPILLGGQQLESAFIQHSSEWSDFEDMEAAKLDEHFQAWGFSVDDPFYEYYNAEEGVDLTLFFDEEKERGIGIYGSCGNRDYYYGFGFESVSDGTGWGYWYRWEEDPFTLPEVECNEMILNVWKEWEYGEEGQEIAGYVYGQVADPRFTDPNRVVLYEMKYTYDEAGILRHKSVWRNFSPSLGCDTPVHDSWYDAQGRLCYEEGYITHGSLQYYYIYEGDNSTPGYCLFIDNNVGYSVPTLIRYEAS